MPARSTSSSAGGSLLLLRLAWQIAHAPAPQPRAHATSSPATGWWPAFLLQWVNPKSWIVAASAAATFSAAPGQPAAWHALLLALLFALAAAPSCGLWLAAGALLQRWLAEPSRARAFHRGMGLLLAASVAMLWV